jgi:FkbM family methyltransferase
MLDTPLVTFARSMKAVLQRMGAHSLISPLQSYYHSVILKDSPGKFIRQRINGEVYRLGPSFSTFSPTYEPHLLAWLQDWLKPDDVFWDVGANFGFTAMPAARIVGESGHVIAIEPSEGNLQHLRRHISLNNLDGIITVMKGAVSETHGGTIKLSLLNNGVSPSNSLMFSGKTNEAAPKVSQEVDVASISLDGLLAQKNNFPTMVKIDVEGAELQVLKGASTLINSESAPIILLAVHPFWQATPDDCGKLVEILKKAGYRILDPLGKEQSKLEYNEYICMPPSAKL